MNSSWPCAGRPSLHCAKAFRISIFFKANYMRFLFSSVYGLCSIMWSSGSWWTSFLPHTLFLLYNKVTRKCDAQSINLVLKKTMFCYKNNLLSLWYNSLHTSMINSNLPSQKLIFIIFLYYRFSTISFGKPPGHQTHQNLKF